jgi:hypothetical protein
LPSEPAVDADVALEQLNGTVAAATFNLAFLTFANAAAILLRVGIQPSRNRWQVKNR